MIFKWDDLLKSFGTDPREGGPLRTLTLVNVNTGNCGFGISSIDRERNSVKSLKTL